MKTAERVLFAEGPDRLTATLTDRFAPVTFVAQAAAIEYIKGSLSAINSDLRDGRQLRSDQIEIVNALLEAGTRSDSDAKKSCGGRCSCAVGASRRSVELFLILAQYCNLGCVYCLDGDETYQRKRNRKMTLETAILAVDGACRDLKAGDELAVTFFGGEPLLNWSIIPDIIYHTKRKCIEKIIAATFTIQSNLSFLPPAFVEMARESNISVISNIDGPADIHNRLRPHRDGKSDSYAATVRALERLRECGVPYMLRATVTSLNDSMLLDVAQLHRSLGATQSIFGLLRPVNSDGIVFDKSLLPSYHRLVSSLRILMHERPDTLLGTVSMILGRMRADRSDRACGAAYALTPTVDANGDVYSCAWFVGQPSRRLGNVRDCDFVSGSGAKRTYEEFAPTLDEVCAACDYFPVCQGGCSVTRLNVDPSDSDDLRGAARLQQCALVKTVMDELLLAEGALGNESWAR